MWTSSTRRYALQESVWVDKQTNVIVFLKRPSIMTSSFVSAADRFNPSTTRRIFVFVSRMCALSPIQVVQHKFGCRKHIFVELLNESDGSTEKRGRHIWVIPDRGQRNHIVANVTALRNLLRNSIGQSKICVACLCVKEPQLLTFLNNILLFGVSIVHPLVNILNTQHRNRLHQ